MEHFEMISVKTKVQRKDLADLASKIWHEHFIPIIGEAQVEYMIAKFQSFEAVSEQLQNGYEYFQLYSDGIFVGYCGIHEENKKLFLSKLYIQKSCRGRHLCTHALHYLIDLCKERRLSSIWLTCNKYNSHTLEVYRHLGFEIIDAQIADIGSGFAMDDYILEFCI